MELPKNHSNSGEIRGEKWHESKPQRAMYTTLVLQLCLLLNPHKTVISTDQREWRNLSISQVLAVPMPFQFQDISPPPSKMRGLLHSRWSVEMTLWEVGFVSTTCSVLAPLANQVAQRKTFEATTVVG